jgi:hypothetical protein
VYWYEEDTEGLLSHGLSELQTALAFDPGNMRAMELLDTISYAIPEAVPRSVSGDILLVLTATPITPPAHAAPIESQL